MPRPLPTLLLVPVLSMLSGCAPLLMYRESQVKNEQQKLMRLYRECIEKHLGDPDAIAKNCEPIVAPLRIRELEGR